ncbi:MAG: hypothetical protein LAP21_01420, partial [Acidobacteriia bacterium]|nr:hypothetical protein [Terriglobia bacterium]
LSFISFGLLHAQKCSDSNYVSFTTPLTRDATEHVVPSDGGDHHFSSFFGMACNYQSDAVAPTQYCVTTSTTQAEVTTVSESGETTPLFYRHYIGANARGGSQKGVNGATASSGGKAAGAVLDCIFSCAVTIQLDAPGDGIGIKVTFPPSTLWAQEAPASGISCGPVLDPTFGPGGGGGGCDQFLGDGSGFAPLQTCGDTSPIILDAEGEGFHLTSAAEGVLFDIRGNGHPIQIAWTAPGSHNAFLALPGPDGLVHNGKELFGNFTPQPKSATPNGFLALAEYDKPEKGGNSDGVIDEHDAVFSKLVLWIDENHDGISQPNELHKLSEFGIHSLSVSYFESRKTDEFGNQFRYKARVNPRKEHRDSRDEKASGEVGRWAYDVFFSTK